MIISKKTRVSMINSLKDLGAEDIELTGTPDKAAAVLTCHVPLESQAAQQIRETGQLAIGWIQGLASLGFEVGDVQNADAPHGCVLRITLQSLNAEMEDKTTMDKLYTVHLVKANGQEYEQADGRKVGYDTATRVVGRMFPDLKEDERIEIQRCR